MIDGIVMVCSPRAATRSISMTEQIAPAQHMPRSRTIGIESKCVGIGGIIGNPGAVPAIRGARPWVRLDMKLQMRGAAPVRRSVAGER